MAVELSKSRTNMVLLAKELDIRAELLYRWRREFLDAEVQELQTERDILKKAVGIFSRSDNKYSGS